MTPTVFMQNHIVWVFTYSVPGYLNNIVSVTDIPVSVGEKKKNSMTTSTEADETFDPIKSNTNLFHLIIHIYLLLIYFFKRLPLFLLWYQNLKCKKYSVCPFSRAAITNTYISMEWYSQPQKMKWWPRTANTYSGKLNPVSCQQSHSKRQRIPQNNRAKRSSGEPK